MNRFENRVVVVAGGNSGIGRAAAEHMLSEGAHVYCLDKDQGEPPVAAADATGSFQAVQVDARDEQAMRNAIDAAAESAGRIDVLVNAVGIELVEEAHRTSTEQWDRVLDTNLKSYFLAIKAVIPHMREGGAIVNVASQLAMVGASRFSAYTASKAGILGMTRSLALELAPKGIRVNAVCPGAVDTPLLRRQFEDGDGPQGSMQDLVGMHPVGRLGRPEEIAAPIAFLAGEDASFMTGSEVVVDGGYTAW